MRSKLATLLAIAVVCVTTAWANWTPEAMITGDTITTRGLFPNSGHKVVFGPDGVGHLIWGGGEGIWCNRYNPGSGWTSDYQVTTSGGNPAIALDADGTTIHAVWEDCYRRCVRGENGEDVWDDVVQIGVGLWPAIASVPGDTNHVVVVSREEFWQRKKRAGGAIWFIECIDGAWNTPIRLDSGASVPFCNSVAVAPNGDVFIAYGRSYHVYVKTRHNGNWGPTVDVTESFPTDESQHPAIEINPYTGNPHVVFDWRRVTKISKKVTVYTRAAYHTYRNAQGGWLTTPELISVPRHEQGIGPWNLPTMAFLSDGSAYAVWHETYPATSRGIMYSYCPAEGGSWSSPVWLSSDTLQGGDGYPFVAVDEYADAVRVVWCRVAPNSGITREIWWRSNYLGGGGGQAQPVALSQTSLELFPNPATAGRVTVQYALPHAGPMTVTLLDVSGRAVRTQEVAAGLKGSVGVDVSGLNAGVYVVKLESGAAGQTRKLVIQ